MTILNCGELAIDVSRIDPKSHLLSEAVIHSVLHKLEDWTQGKAINITENRPAMHMALRADKNTPLPSDYVNNVLAERARQKAFVEGCKADNILHIGIGGSDFGPRLVYDALGCSATMQRKVHFLSSLTPEAIEKARDSVNHQRDIIILASKSFSTDETSYLLHLFTRVFGWPMERIIAVTAAPEKALAAGFTKETIFPFWSWVGGRFSVWSSVGLSIALAYGWNEFTEFLAGAAMMDDNLMAKKEQSLPFQLATIFSNERHLMNRNALAILPYHYNLALLPTYLQQLIMESNGKPGKQTASIVFGQLGTEFQHSFGQFLHQGPDNCLSIFIDVTKEDKDEWAQNARKRLHANAKAQADTLWQGSKQTEDYKTLPGKRPSLFISMPDLTARNIGALLALFEHITVLDAFINDVNPFDQWGVEAGKIMAQKQLNNGS